MEWSDTGLVGEAVCKAAGVRAGACAEVCGLSSSEDEARRYPYVCFYPGKVGDVLVGFQLCLEPLIDTDPFIRVSCGTYPWSSGAVLWIILPRPLRD